MIDYNQHYYNEDKPVGDKLFIDSKDSYLEFNADLKKFVVGPPAIEPDTAPSCGKSLFRTYSSIVSPREAEVEFYVGGTSDEDAQSNISNILLACKECVLRKSTGIFEYPAVLTSSEIEEPEVENYYLLKLKFVVIRRKPLITVPLHETAILYNDGNVQSGIKFEIQPVWSIDQFTIFGITIFDLIQNVTYVIDGIEGRITANGINCFSQTDIIDFPKIQPGKNIVRLSDQIPVNASYYPVFY